MSDFARILSLRGMAANIGAAYEQAALAWDRADSKTAMEWDKLAGDIVFLLRDHARDNLVEGVVEREYKTIMDKWDKLTKAL
jgi:hypothetical protein